MNILLLLGFVAEFCLAFWLGNTFTTIAMIYLPPLAAYILAFVAATGVTLLIVEITDLTLAFIITLYRKLV